jgi:hypothetical protein
MLGAEETPMAHRKTALAPVTLVGWYQQALRAAGKAAVDDWLRQMGPAGAQILDAYRDRR